MSKGGRVSSTAYLDGRHKGKESKEDDEQLGAQVLGDVPTLLAQP